VSARAGIAVTGTEVLTGRVRDRNGPWLSDRLFELGVDLAQIVIVGDRPADMEQALRFMAAQGLDLIVTSGGLGPTADDLTAEVVGRVQGREMVLDEGLQARIAEIMRPLAERYPHLDRQAIAAANRKQATIPRGATVLEPVGTAPGLVVPPGRGHEANGPGGGVVGDAAREGDAAGSAAREGDAAGSAARTVGPTIVVLPGPPRELQPMWAHAVQTDAFRAAIAAATVYRQGVLRLFGIPESEIAETLRKAERQGLRLEELEITTCLRGGEIEVVTRYEPRAQGTYEAFARIVEERHADTIFSRDGSTVDDQVERLLRNSPPSSRDSEPSAAGEDLPLTIAVAESCTGGLLAARLTGPPGASDYVLGGIVAYANEVKVSQTGVDPALIERHGAVSAEVAGALAAGARARLGANVGVGVTGVAGPGGGTEAKPVGLVWLSVHGPNGSLTHSVRLPGGRADVRERAVTVAMHMIRRVLCGETDGARSLQPAPQGPV
jgi:nicotinamide-nucleotide amidase